MCDRGWRVIATCRPRISRPAAPRGFVTLHLELAMGPSSRRAREALAPWVRSMRWSNNAAYRLPGAVEDLPRGACAPYSVGEPFGNP